ncbi:MAG: hypothetical protein IPL46_08645 [Saprospiraceae bacterium]|nr:hypothetical protein [Saprospiraceae bacterium]
MRKAIKYLSLLVVLMISCSVEGQSPYLPLDESTYHWLDRLDVLFENPTDLHFTIKGVSRKDVAVLVEAVDSLYPDRSQPEMLDLQWLLDQNNEWAKQKETELLEKQFIDSSGLFYTFKSESQETLAPRISKRPILKHFYRTPANLFEVNAGDFSLRVIPLLNFRLAKDRVEDVLLFENQRGISIRGSVDQKVYFHTDILESQARYPNYVNDFRLKFSAVPGAGFYKPYVSSVLKLKMVLTFY